MRTIRKLFLAFAILAAQGLPTQAKDTAHDMASEHGGQIFHKFTLEAEYGSNQKGGLASWDLDGWIGTDDNKARLKSEGRHQENKLEDTELWALYSRNISTFWDAQIGLRQDIEPKQETYATLGIEGIAPYWFDINAHLFISTDGIVSTRLRAENDILVTQKLILQPYAEINVSAQDNQAKQESAGVTDTYFGLQTRYEYTRKFAPYFDINYGRNFNKTDSSPQEETHKNDGFGFGFGLRFMY